MGRKTAIEVGAAGAAEVENAADPAVSAVGLNKNQPVHPWSGDGSL